VACISRSSRAALHFFSSTFLDCLLCLHRHGMLQKARALAAASMQNSFASANDDLIVAFRSRLAQKNDRTVRREIQLRATCVCLLCFLLQQSGEAQSEERFDEGEFGMRVELSLPSARHISLSQSVWPRDLLHQSDEMKANFFVLCHY